MIKRIMDAICRALATGGVRSWDEADCAELGHVTSTVHRLGMKLTYCHRCPWEKRERTDWRDML